MAQAEIRYTTAAVTGSPAHQVDLIVTYDPASINANGYYTATAAMGTYTVLDVNGNVSRVDQITGLGAPRGYGNNTNFFRFDQTTNPYVTVNGLNYSISNPADTFPVGNGVVNFYQTGGTAGNYTYLEYNQSGTGNARAQ